MALVAARGFSGGPMSDIDYGMVASNAAWVETPGALAVTQPNTGTRSVSIAAGWHDGFGIRQNNDAAITQALTAPSSGGAWYLIALRRDWAAKTCTLVVLAGATTGSTTAPTAIPTAMPADAKNTPGAQHDQPLAWAFVNSANTTVTLFDARLIDSRGRGLTAATFSALMTLGMSGLVQEGATIAVAQHTLASGGLHVASLWSKRQGNGWRLVGRLTVDDSTLYSNSNAQLQNLLTTTGNSRADIIGLATTAWAIPLVLTPNDELVDFAGGAVHRFAATFGGTTVWRPYDTPWFGVSGLLGIANIAGPITTAFIRYAAGVCYFELSMSVNNMGSGQVSFTLPTGVATRGFSSALPFGHAMLIASDGRKYVIALDWDQGNSNARTITTRALYAVSTSDTRQVEADTSGNGAPTAWNGGTFYLSCAFQPYQGG